MANFSISSDTQPFRKPAIPKDATVLVVEDEEEVCQFACDALTKKGYQVYAAKNGYEALKLIEKGFPRYDLVITDLVMPELGGVEFAEQAKHLAPELNVIFVSGYVDKYVISNDLFEEGINFIQKPYSVATLAGAVRKILDKPKSPNLSPPPGTK